MIGESLATVRQRRRAMPRPQPFPQEPKHALDRFPRRFAFLVDQPDGQHAMWRLGVKLARLPWKLDPLEPLAKFAPQGREPRRRIWSIVPEESDPQT